MKGAPYWPPSCVETTGELFSVLEQLGVDTSTISSECIKQNWESSRTPTRKVGLTAEDLKQLIDEPPCEIDFTSKPDTEWTIDTLRNGVKAGRDEVRDDRP